MPPRRGQVDYGESPPLLFDDPLLARLKEVHKERSKMWEYKVVEEKFGSPQETESKLNELARDGWEHYHISTLGPIPSRWLYFRRQKQAAKG